MLQHISICQVWQTMQEVNIGQNVKAASDVLVRADLSQQFCDPFGFEAIGRETELQPENQEGIPTTFHHGQVSSTEGNQNVIYCASW